MSIIHVERITEKAEFRLGVSQNRYCKDVETVLDLVQTMLRKVILRCSNHALLFFIADGVFRRVGILTRFDFYKNQRVPFPSDHVDFAELGSVVRGYDSIAKRSEVADCLYFGAA